MLSNFVPKIKKQDYRTETPTVLPSTTTKHRSDLFLLSNPRGTKSADFISRKKNILFYVEGKTSSGGSALSGRLSEGAKQADRIVINLTNYSKLKRLAENIKATFIQNPSLRELLIFKGSILIQIDRYLITSKDYSKIIFKEFNRKK